jgi:PHD/YefM family antitoxin component YafN of YafNO toxin-antitoxin module
MAQIIPIRDLKDTSSLSKLVESTNEPIYVTKNGYGSMVIMNMMVFEQLIQQSLMVEGVQESLDHYAKTGEGIEGELFIEDMKRKMKK